jgi:microcystin-dependent protein
MADQPFLGEIRLFGGNFAPRGWAMCNGQLLAISQNSALFALLGTTYGGDGQSTFALPDLRSRIPIHVGPGFAQGQVAGTESVSLTAQTLPAHSHIASAATNGTTDSPVGGFPATDPAGNVAQFKTNTTANATMNSAAIKNAGGGQPHANIQPILVVTYIIALEGVFPSQN